MRKSNLAENLIEFYKSKATANLCLRLSEITSDILYSIKKTPYQFIYDVIKNLELINEAFTKVEEFKK